MLKPLLLSLGLMICCAAAYAQTPVKPPTPLNYPPKPDNQRKVTFKDPNQPPPDYFVDSILRKNTDLQDIDPNTVAHITVRKPTTPDAHPNGVVYIETKPFVRNRYWLIFSQDAAYRKLVPSPGEDNDIVYVVDGKVVTKDPEGSLAVVNANTFEGLTILNRKTLEQQYGVKGRKHGVLVKLKNIK
ncbi:hypothetical protein [Chitinophaga qingshengii]|uniref:Uncharacterized protein n=1 Tax=Chitinophaga qingshengii TaxID=1569794 RepID=A0ABR7TYW2_9BACT|nr:hypothetical protein [Chitinophaga qingshengii]MBC9934992.1 hypothetical protein [Chitinophaga qingshengii]